MAVGPLAMLELSASATVVSPEARIVIGVDAVPSKLDRARELGASAAFTPDEAMAAGIRAAVAVEAVGHPRAFETAFALTAPGGRTVTVGLPSAAARVELSPLTVTAEARTIVGSYLGSRGADTGGHYGDWFGGRGFWVGT